jgi:prevent-host-death family protein
MRWPTTDARQRLRELIEAARTDGPQVITLRGEDVAAVLSTDDYRRLSGQSPDFREYLRSGPPPGDLDLTRPRELPRQIDLTG